MGLGKEIKKLILVFRFHKLHTKRKVICQIGYIEISILDVFHVKLEKTVEDAPQ